MRVLFCRVPDQVVTITIIVFVVLVLVFVVLVIFVVQLVQFTECHSDLCGGHTLAVRGIANAST